MKNGKDFVYLGVLHVCWCKLLSRNPFVNTALVLRRINEDYGSILTSNKEEFLEYMTNANVIAKEPETKQVKRRESAKKKISNEEADASIKSN